jgi:UDP-glucuronate 4-epimerase
MTTLVTGAAGFIGFHVVRALLARGEAVIGVDTLNAYYDPALKRARLDQLSGSGDFTFSQADIADIAALRASIGGHRVRRVIHLAAQAGVRYAFDHPLAYVEANLVGHGHVLELCRGMEGLEHLVYASSSSVYGGNTKVPFSEEDRVDTPVSFYAATKRANELMSQSYAHLYGLPQTGLRFFTVYGPWGRPDMAYWTFTKAIFSGAQITLYEGGMRRDFTYIDDAVDGILRVLDNPPAAKGGLGGARHRIYNIGNNRPEPVERMIAILERLAGRRAVIRHAPPPPGDVIETFADIEAMARDFGFRPHTPLETGLERFVEWYRAHHGV